MPSRTVVLDGGTLLDVPIFELMATNSQEALDSVFKRCAADRACKAAFPNLAHDLASATARLSAHPVKTDVLDPWTEERIVVDGNALASAIHQLLVSHAAYQIPLLLHHAAAGRVDEVADLIRDTSEGPATAADRRVMYWSIVCSEGSARVDPTRTAELGADSYYSADTLEWAREVAFGCSLLPEGYFPAGDSDAVTSAVPVLLLNGMEDPQYPPTSGAHASVDFSQQFHDSGAGPGSHRRATWLSARRGGRVLRIWYRKKGRHQLR
jgi:hypothetical protein